MENYSPTIKVMLDAVRKSSRGLARDFGEVENLQVSKKGPKDFVTSADLKAESILIRELQKARPEYSILSEEAGFIKGADSEYCWIMDPLDGTNNFLHGVPYFCTTIALEKKLPNGKKEIIAAVTEAPMLRETFWAEKHGGAWLETAEVSGTHRLRVSARTKLHDSLLAIGSFMSDAKDIGLLNEFVATRCLGSTALALAYMAAGKFDCFMHNGAKVWDIAAGSLLVTEAKGAVCDTSGRQKMFESQSVLATNSDLQPLVLKKLAK